MLSIMAGKSSFPGWRHFMKNNLHHLLLLVFCLLIYTVGASPLSAEDESLCGQIASYTMDVTLDTETKIITATELLSWTNSTETPTDEMWFHLYWNAFQNNMSDFLAEGTQRWGRIIRKNKKQDWGYCRVDSIEVIEDQNFSEADLKPTIRFRHPDNDNTFDRTVFSVQLPKPLTPGQTIRLKIDFHSQVPRPIHRTGTHKDYYFIAQWFPKIGVFDQGQWNCHQFHATTNFFADFGTYDIKITLPSSYIIGATGEHLEKIENSDGTTTHRFIQHSVHDFAWTASPYYLKYVEPFEFSHGKSTEITLLLQPYHENQKDRYMNAVKNALKYCSLWYGDYPYTTITCVDPAYNSRSGGMEYPTLFTGGTYFLSPEGTARPEGVTIHEFGHGYFYGLVASNEFEDAWMDEGFTSFLDSEVYQAAYGDTFYSRSYFGIPCVFKEVSIPIESSGISRHRQTYDMDIMQKFTWHFMNSSSYGANSYSKAELMLRTLKRFMGPELFAGMIKAYSQRHWFKHPQPQDFYAVVSEFAGQDMSWFLDQFVYGSGKLDYAIGEISNAREIVHQGWFDGEFSEEKKNPDRQEHCLSEVLVRRLGEVKIPVDVLIVFEDGSKILESWDGQYRWKKFNYSSPARVRLAIVDPEFKLVSDINRTNNSSTVKSSKIGALKWTARWLTWLQHALEFFSLFGG
jgi:hypothetical protein